jgi:hypothetical protein
MVLYGAISRPEDDVSVSGGAIDVTHRPLRYELSWRSLIQVVSTGFDDIRTVTIYGQDITGNDASGTISLQAMSPVSGVIEFLRVDKIEVSSAHPTYTISVIQQLGALVIHQINPGETGAFRMFLNANSNTVEPLDRHEKLFWKNTDDSDVPTEATVQLSHDAIGKLTIGLEATIDGTQSVPTRLDDPGVTFYDDNIAVGVPGGTLPAGSAIGVWIRQTLSANDGPYDAFGGLLFCGEFPENANEGCCPELLENPCLFNCAPGVGVDIDTSLPEGCEPPEPPEPPVPPECPAPCPSPGQTHSVIYDGATINGGPAINVDPLSVPDENYLVTAIYFPALNVISLVWYDGESNTEFGTVLGSVSATLVPGDELRISHTTRVGGALQFSVYVNDALIIGPVTDAGIPEDDTCFAFFTLEES